MSVDYRHDFAVKPFQPGEAVCRPVKAAKSGYFHDLAAKRMQRGQPERGIKPFNLKIAVEVNSASARQLRLAG